MKTITVWACIVRVVRVATVLTLLAVPGWSQNNPVPQINLPLVPGSAAPGGPAFTLTVNGSGFVSGSAVYWNGVARTTTFVSNIQLTAQITAQNIASAATAPVTVVNPPPGGGFSNVAFFMVANPTSMVSLSGFTAATGNTPAAVVTADFNGDHFQDMAVANESDNTVSIMLGNGDGTFQNHVDYATGLGPQDLVVGDFNHDGFLDLAVVNAGENSSGQYADTVSILLGNGDGTFQAHVDYPTGQDPVRVATGDFNRDGALDLAVADEYSNAVSILLGNGDGTFQTNVDYNVSAEPVALIVCDFNRDGIPDLGVAAFAAHAISIMLGNGDGTFQAPNDYTASQDPSGLVAGDFNNDGIQDLAVADWGSSAVSILLGNGDGSFQNQVRYTTGTYPEGVTTGDFNGDGILDLALAVDTGLGSVSLLIGNGDGTFQNVTNFGAGILPTSLALADFTGDGTLDAAAVDVEANAISVLLQSALAFSPTSLTFAAQNLGTTSSPQAVTLINLGAVPITVTSIATTGTFAETNTCGTSLAAGASCAVSVTFTPTAAGTSNGSLSITDSATGSPQTVILSGTGNGATLTFAPSSLNFGNQTVNTTSPSQSIVVTNTGNVTLNFTSFATSPGFNQTNTCGSSLAPNATCTFSVTFSPGQPGTINGTLSVTDSGYLSPQTVPLTGVGTQGVVTFNPPGGLTFAVQLLNTTSSPQTLTLTNTGNATLSISSVSSLTSFSQTNNCGTTVGVGASCTFTVTFKPANIGTLSGNFNVYDNGLASPQSFSVSGTATQVSLVPVSLNFGNVNLGSSSSAQAVTLTNVGSTLLNITSISFGGTNSTDFSQTNNCGASVGAQASCIIDVTFTPGGQGTRSATLSVYDNGGASPQNVALTGTGVPGGNGPIATFSPASVNFPNQNWNTKSAPQTVTLMNTGNQNLTISSVTISGDFAISTNTCTGSLTPGAKCTVAMTFTPTQIFLRTGALTVTDNAPDSPQMVPLSGTGVGSYATVAPNSLTFPVQLVGTASTPQVVTLTNTGNATLTINNVTVPTGFTQNDNCNGSVAAGATCTFNVAFAPTKSGTASGNLQIFDNSTGGSPQKIALSGTGTVVLLNPTSLSFGSIYLGQSSPSQAVTLTNVGSSSITITSVTFTGNNPGDFKDTSGCGSSVGAGASCTISVTFTPMGVGTRAASLSINDTGGASPQTVAVTGTGQPTSSGPAVGFNPTSVNFGNQNYNTKSKVSTVTITNTGGATLNISSITTTGNFAQTNTCLATLASGASCSASVTFTPKAVGLLTGTLSVTDNGTGSPQTVPLSGTGVGAQVTLNPSSLTFNTQVVGTTSPSLPVTLTNTGNATLTITSVVSSQNFGQTNNCGSSVAAGASCSVNVTFTPTNSGTLSGSITINDNAAGSASQKIAVSGTGTIVELSPTSVNFGSVPVGQTSSSETVTLTNVSSTKNISSIAVSITGNDPGDFSQTNTCGKLVGPLGTCTFTLTFAPQATGSRTASLSISDSGGGSPQTVSLSGTGE